jgi:signal transduction histidine kinase
MNSSHLLKRNLLRLSRRYRVALRKHLKQGPQASLQPARRLGCQAVAIGLETLDVVKFHQDALASLESSASKDGIIGRAELFFTEAITPIEKTHQAALKTDRHLSRLNRILGRRAAALAVTNRSLMRGVAQRKAAEETLKKRGKHSKRLLQESLALQKHLQHLTHRILSVQEHKRKAISRDLQDEIAQTLLGINVRLLTLKKQAAVNAKGLRKEIARTERLVDTSVKSIERFAREFGKNHEG